MNDCKFLGKLRQVQCFLDCAVSAAYYIYIFAFIGWAILCSIKADAFPREFGLPWNAKRSGGGSVCEDDFWCFIMITGCAYRLYITFQS